jgi:hypothetical protein
MPSTTPVVKDEHGLFSWTACYDDGCFTHKSDKEGAGWYPKRNKDKMRQQDSPPILLEKCDIEVNGTQNRPTEDDEKKEGSDLGQNMKG